MHFYHFLFIIFPAYIHQWKWAQVKRRLHIKEWSCPHHWRNNWLLKQNNTTSRRVLRKPHGTHLSRPGRQPRRVLQQPPPTPHALRPDGRRHRSGEQRPRAWPREVPPLPIKQEHSRRLPTLPRHMRRGIFRKPRTPFETNHEILREEEVLLLLRVQELLQEPLQEPLQVL